MLSNKYTGERAFHFFDERKMNTPEYGLTIRDYFAAKAMQACRSRNSSYAGWHDLAVDAYEIADAMIEARSK
jgi:hypothetical protein